MDLLLIRGPLTTSLIAALLPPLLFAMSLWSTRRATRSLHLTPEAASSAQQFHHRAMFALRIMLIAGFAFLVLATPWPTWFDFGRVTPELQIIGDLVVLSPFVLGMVAVWAGAYPIEKRVHTAGWWIDFAPAASATTFLTYLDFHLRHQLLIVAVPLTLILFAANLTGGYGSELRRALGSEIAPDLLLGLAAGVVFVAAPVLLRRIWRTESLPSGELRTRLQTLCRRINLRVRDILVWKSDGLMINAAVMGVTGRLRYVLLSDALLAAMSPQQVEAVFAHEAGHVRHRHIPHFLMFALAAWVVVAGLMEGLAVIAAESPGAVSIGTIQEAGITGTMLVWGIGFGWVSRRFERQADLFGARCAAPLDSECQYPCSVHLNSATQGSEQHEQKGRVCATGAAIFASALERVAVLNGIPREERSWRHSSIASRIRFLLSLAADPSRTVRFERLVWRTQLAMLLIGLGGSAASLLYWRAVGTPALIRIQTGDLPAAVVSPIAQSGQGSKPADRFDHWHP